MKKVFLSLMLAVTFAVSHAQLDINPGVNMFMSFGAGAGYAVTPNTTGPGFSGGIAVGKWVVNPLAVRFGVDFTSTPLNEEATKFVSTASASAEVLWDFNATFTRIKNWRVNIYPLIGLGAFYIQPYTFDGHSYGTDHEFHVLGGVNIPVRLGLGWDVFMEYKCFFLPRYNFHTLALGLTHNFTESPFTRHRKYDSKSVAEDWFVGLGMGLNFSAFDIFNNPNWGGMDMIGAAPEIMFGRNFNHLWTVRIELTGLTAREQYDTINEESGESYTFSMLHADIMFNVLHAFDFKRGSRLGILPYAGAGPIWRYDNPQFTLGADAGIMFRYYLNRHGDLFADIKYIMMPPRIGGGIGPQHEITGVGIASLTFGYIYNFGQSSARYRMPVNTCPVDM